MSAVVVIGGGPAGLTAAIASARVGARVTLLERGPRVGRKILASGNGRCNLSHTDIAPAAYNAPDFVAPLLAAFPAEEISRRFEALGLATYADGEGRVYPATNAAASVLEVLRLESARLGVDERVDCETTAILPGPGGVRVSATCGELTADAVVVATGGGSALLEALGHRAVPTSAVLGPLKTDREPIRGLDGVRVRCAATVHAAADDALRATETGELLFRDYGVSGIMVFDLSRAATPGDTLAIDFFPDTPRAELESQLAERTRTLGWRTAGTFFDGLLHSRVAVALLRTAGIPADTPATDLPVTELAALLKAYRVTIASGPEPKQAQVTRGGADVADFDPLTLESRIAPRVFAAGEVLDVDGRCGGYNLHWAWASGFAAGEAAAALAERPERAHGAPAHPTTPRP